MARGHERCPGACGQRHSPDTAGSKTTESAQRQRDEIQEAEAKRAVQQEEISRRVAQEAEAERAVQQGDWSAIARSRESIVPETAHGRLACSTTSKCSPGNPAVRALRDTIYDPRRAITNSLGMKFALIPAGEFLMGSPDD